MTATLTKKFTNAGRALLIAAVLGAGGLAAAAPAMAQSEPSFNFNLELGAPDGGAAFEFGIEGGDGPETFRHRGGDFGGDFRDDFFRRCLSDRAVIAGLHRYGFERVEVLDASYRRAELIGRWGRDDYLMQADKCTGEVDILERLRRRGGSGFGLQFNFGG